jgi:outer membrane immunogenic protein
MKGLSMKKLLTLSAALGALLATSTAALSADVDIASTYDWSGLYLGLNVGYAWLDPDPAAANFIQPNSDGFEGGARAGWNWQINNLVLGVEGDFHLSDLSETDSCFNPAFNCNAGSDWNASIRGRLGLAFDRLMIFGTGGYAAADFDGYTDNGTRFSDSTTLHGWTAGAGAEYAWTDNVLVSLEYRYSNFGSKTLTYDVAYPLDDPDMHQVILGLSWKF